MKTYTVYKHINRINKKVYIGMTEQNPKNRWKNGNYHSYRFKADIDKYGWENFDHEILFQTENYDEACQMEKCLIIENDSTNPDKGYNCIIGGGGGMKGHQQTDESKKKISDKMKQYVFTDTHKKHISESKSGLRHHDTKSVMQYSKAGEFIKKWAYMSLAAQQLSISKMNISQCCHGMRPSAGGYVWKYE